MSHKSGSLPECKKSSTSPSTTSRKRVREDLAQHVTMNEEEYRRYQEQEVLSCHRCESEISCQGRQHGAAADRVAVEPAIFSFFLFDAPAAR